MKKLLVIIAALFVAVSAHAQLGVVAGITSSSSNLKDAKDNFSNISQYHAGLTCKIGFGEIFAIQPSIIYNMKGTKISEIKDVSSEVDYKTGYLEVPVQLQLGAGVRDIFRVYGFAEPFVGYALTNQVTKNGNTQTDWEQVKNKLEYGVSLGAGLELIKHVQVSLKYFWNLGNVYDFDLDAASSKVGQEATCNGIAASVAILF